LGKREGGEELGKGSGLRVGARIVGWRGGRRVVAVRLSGGWGGRRCPGEVEVKSAQCVLWEERHLSLPDDHEIPFVFSVEGA